MTSEQKEEQQDLERKNDSLAQEVQEAERTLSNFRKVGKLIGKVVLYGVRMFALSLCIAVGVFFGGAFLYIVIIDDLAETGLIAQPQQVSETTQQMTNESGNEN